MHDELENGQGYARNRKREMRLWWIRGFHETCGYCGCLPTRHSKRDSRYSSDSVGGTSGAGTTESASPEKWKHEYLGWFPNPKGECTEFWNNILLKFYLSYWTTCPLQGRFRPLFVTERKRQCEVREALNAINHKLAFAIRTPRGNITAVKILYIIIKKTVTLSPLGINRFDPPQFVKNLLMTLPSETPAHPPRTPN